MIRSILAVIAGIVALTITSFAIEFVANTLVLRLFPNTALTQNTAAIGFGLLYTSLSVVFGGYVTAWIARRAPVPHAAIMGAVLVALTIVEMVSVPHPAPLWTWIVAFVMIIPCAWFGGTLRRSRSVPLMD